MSEKLELKICVIGNQNVGKSALVYKFVHDSFLQDDDPTLEDRYNKDFVTEDKQTFHLRLLDTGGSDETYENLADRWIEECDGFIVVYSVCSKTSFEKVIDYIEHIRRLKRNAVIAIAGTQSDRGKNTREVPVKDLLSFAEQVNCDFMECSAKTGDGIREIFEYLVKKMKMVQDSLSPPVSPEASVKRGFSPRIGRKASSPNISRLLSSSGSSSKIHNITDQLMEEDTWSSVKPPVRKWNEITNPDPSITNLLATENGTAEGFTFELGKNDVPYSSKIELEDASEDIPYYRLYFYGREHLNLFGENESMGTVIISCDPPQKNTPRRCILRTKRGNERILIPPSHSSSKKDILKYIQNQRPEIADIKNFNRVADSETQNDLVEYEKKEIVQRYKFGVLYCKDGQDENAMFSNADHVPELEELLAVLGDKTELKGFTGYSGGLDTKTNTTGLHSVYTIHHNCEIMFHVSTLLPFQEDDAQRVERKRHLGNDIVLIIFKDGDEPFDPTIMKSHFNHIFCIVRVHSRNEDGTVNYSVGISNKAGVSPYGPFLPDPPVFKGDASFRNFLLTKLINGERWCLKGGEFRGTNIRTRKETLDYLHKSLNNRPKEKKKKTNSSLNLRATSPVKIPGSPSSSMSLDRYPSSADSSPPSSPVFTPVHQRSRSIGIAKTDSNIPAVSQRDIYISASSNTKYDQKKIDKIIECARSLAASSHLEPSKFNSGEFRDQLYQLVSNTVATFTGTDYQLEAIIEQAKSFAETGHAIVTLQEKRKNSSISEELMEQWRVTQNEFAEKLVRFIQMLNASVEREEEEQAKQKKHVQTGSLRNPKAQDPSRSIERPAEVVGKTTLEIANMLQKSEFDSEVFTKYMRAIFDSIKQIAQIADTEVSQSILDAVKPLLRKAVNLKNDPGNFDNRKNFIAELTNICALLRQHTSASS